MAVKLRLRRMGKKRQPIYKIVAVDARAPRDGKFIEAVGSYNPKTNPHTVDVNVERALYWLNVGAQPTDTVRSLLRQTGVTLKRELIKRGLSLDEVETRVNEWKAEREAAKAKKSTEKKAKKASATEATGAVSE